jgi:SAM-dependent MidA family methyltransferase
VPSAADEIVAAIAAQGPLRFDHFIQLALYGPFGFYNAGGSAGRRGDFITSPEIGPLFGSVLARYLAAERDRLGVAELTVIEAGAGPGTLARSIKAACDDPKGGLGDVRYIAVEVSAPQRERHPDQVESVGDLPPGPIVGVIVANELLDNLPFRLLVFDGGWCEAFVERSGDRFVEVLAPLAEVPSWLPASAPHGARAPWQQAAAEWVHRARDSLQSGSVVVFDYVSAQTRMLAHDPWRAWLRTYRGHDRGDHYLMLPGTQDITAQVALDQLPPADVVQTQADFLRLWGIDELIDEGRRAWEAGAARPTVAALTMRSRVREADALLDPAGLGGFSVLTWRVAEPT